MLAAPSFALGVSMMDTAGAEWESMVDASIAESVYDGTDLVWPA